MFSAKAPYDVNKYEQSHNDSLHRNQCRFSRALPFLNSS